MVTAAAMTTPTTTGAPEIGTGLVRPVVARQEPDPQSYRSSGIVADDRPKGVRM